jgi:hypothetical protein
VVGILLLFIIGETELGLSFGWVFAARCRSVEKNLACKNEVVALVD